MSAGTIHNRIESETLHLSQLKPLIGEIFEIVVREEQVPKQAADWDAARQAARELDNHDFDAWRRQREFDEIQAADQLP